MNRPSARFISPAGLAAIIFLILVLSNAARAQGGKALYDEIKSFQLTGGAVSVTGLVLKRDRVTMTFNGTLYFTPPVTGRVTGAVFIGSGTFKADVPPGNFEKANIKRLLGIETDVLESDFKTAVLRFTDDTFDIIGKNKSDGAPTPQAVKLASELQPRVLEATGANLSSRVALSILNGESSGFFFAELDGGKRGRFNYLFDPQNRIPTDYFGINAGERGLIYKYEGVLTGNDVWMAFYDLEDYRRGTVSYSDINDVVDIASYDMNIDLRAPRKRLALQAKMSVKSRIDNLRAVTFTIGESLSEYDEERLKKQMHIKSVRFGSAALDFVQEPWESAFTVFFPPEIMRGEVLELEMDLEGDFLRQPDGLGLEDCSYPRSNSNWYPRQGYLDRSTFNFTYTHSSTMKIASTGTRKSETPDPVNKEVMVTKYVMNYPVALATFALGPFQRHVETIKWDNGDPPIPLEFNSLSGGVLELKEDFMLAELNNSVRFFQDLFGKYPYETYGAVFHPYGFGQGFATMLTIPNTDRANKYTYSFISHETAHQWWGNIVLWRSYRDQWLSEGFAEYSGVLYTAKRQNPKAAVNLIEEMRRSLRVPPQNMSGYEKGKLNDVGPVILGQRLNTRKTFGAYSALVYNKGALILRMLNFLLTDPATGNGQPFFDMMKDFVNRHRNGMASTDDFRIVANEHFAKSPIAKLYGAKDLNWFFIQWVYNTELPSYEMKYRIDSQPDGTAVVSGTVTQENAGDKSFMPLPVVFQFGGKNVAYATVVAYGPSAPFKIKLPSKPEKVELDPDKWVLSEKTSTSQ
jgi:hypothetical protein